MFSILLLLTFIGLSRHWWELLCFTRWYWLAWVQMNNWLDTHDTEQDSGFKCLCCSVITVNWFNNILCIYCMWIRAGSVSVFGVGIGIRYFRLYFFMSVRYSVSVFLKYWLKITNYWYPTSIWCPYWGWPCRNFTVGSPFGKLEWWGQQAMNKFDSNLVWPFRYINVTNRRTPPDSKGRAMDCVAR